MNNRKLEMEMKAAVCGGIRNMKYFGVNVMKGVQGVDAQVHKTLLRGRSPWCPPGPSRLVNDHLSVTQAEVEKRHVRRVIVADPSCADSSLSTTGCDCRCNLKVLGKDLGDRGKEGVQSGHLQGKQR